MAGSAALVGDGEQALHQAEFQRDHFGHAGQLLADQRFFGGAIHLQDADGRYRQFPFAAWRGQCFQGALMLLQQWSWW
jgi:hypothetical protein